MMMIATMMIVTMMIVTMISNKDDNNNNDDRVKMMIRRNYKTPGFLNQLKHFGIVIKQFSLTCMTPPPLPGPQCRNSSGRASIFPNQSVVITSSSVHAGLVA